MTTLVDPYVCAYAPRPTLRAAMYDHGLLKLELTNGMTQYFGVDGKYVPGLAAALAEIGYNGTNKDPEVESFIHPQSLSVVTVRGDLCLLRKLHPRPPLSLPRPRRTPRQCSKLL